MKLSISRTELQKGLGRIQSIVEKRHTMPILSNVLLETSQGSSTPGLVLTGTDLEVGIRTTHEAVFEAPGRVTTSAKKLYEIVRELPDDVIHLGTPSDAYLTISCGRAVFTLNATPADEYPTLPDLSAPKTVTLHPAVLGEMIERTLYAASADETRYNLNGVYLEPLPEAGRLRMVATDGHRLAYVDRNLGISLDDLPTGVIIPRKGLAELKHLVDEEDLDEVQIGLEETSAVAHRGGVTLVMRLIEGEFPDYRQVIPREATHQLTIATGVLRQALRRVALLSVERSGAVKLELSKGQLQLSARNPDLGEASEELEINYSGPGLTIAFNARYLLDALAVTHAKEVHLGFGDPASPLALTPTDDNESLAVVMPMRV